MLKTIIAKEVRNNILSFRFMVSFVLLFLIVTVTTLVLTGDLARRQQEYSQRQADLETYLKTYAHFNRIGNILQFTQPPIPFQALIRGLTSDVNIQRFDDDPLPVMFPLIDLTFIVTVLVSLVALILSYDAICGEREDGTLKLMLANGLPRSKILMAKFAGGSLTILAPFLVSLGAGMLIILAHPGISWTGADWAALALVIAGAAAYVSVFYLIGLLISSLHKSSSSSVMTSLFVWVLLVLIVPNLSPYVASYLSPTPSRIKVSRETDRLGDTDRDDLGRKLQAQYVAEVVKQYPVLEERLTGDDLKRRIAEDPAYRKAYEARRAASERAWREANEIQGEKIRALRDDLQRKEQAQTSLARGLSMVSPLADFSYLATDLSSTGIRNMAHFDQIYGRWSRLFYGEYEPKKVAEMKAKDPTVDYSNTPVDMTDAPRFRYTEEDLGGRVQAALPPFAVLLGYGILLFAGAYTAFVRYDAR